MALQVPVNGSGSVIDTNTIGSKERQNVTLGDPVTVANLVKVDATGSLQIQAGGANTTPIAAAAAASAIKASAGRLRRVLVTVAGTAALNLYDNATTNSGTIIGVVTASAVAGTVFTFDMIAANGIWCNSGTNTPAVTIAYD